jgi:hypothetical protein
MKDPRVETLVAELKYTVDRLNRLTDILERTGTYYKLARLDKFEIVDLRQEVKY